MTRSRKPTPLDAYVAARIRQRRLELGLAYEQLADAMGLSHEQVRNRESGAQAFEYSDLWRFAGALDVSIVYFFEDMPAPPPSPD